VQEGAAVQAAPATAVAAPTTMATTTRFSAGTEKPLPAMT
jgi:hypothetical protein